MSVIKEKRDKLCIGVFSTFMIRKYIDQCIGCHETWEKHADKYGVKVFYHLANTMDKTITWPNIVFLKDVSDDYESAFDKHFKGMKHLYETVEADWYFSAGSDTFLNIQNSLDMLKKYDASTPIVIGGAHRYDGTRLGEYVFTWYSGAGGYFVSRPALELMLKYFDTIKQEWYDLCKVAQAPNFRPACDVCFFYIIHKNKLPIQIVMEKQIHSCNHKGIFFGTPCSWGCVPNYQTLVTCHFMGPEESKYYMDILENRFCESKYNKLKTTPSDIHEHIPTLYEYSKDCQSIAELGIKNITSSWAFLKGLIESKEQNKKLITFNTQYNPEINEVKETCKQNNIEHMYMLGNDTKFDIPKVDLLFVDTWHVYGQLKRELEKHHGSVNKYIIMHDTSIDEWTGESIRNGWDLDRQCAEVGYNRNEISVGIGPAITDFMKLHGEWTLHKKFTNNNGLTILKRR